MWERNKVLSCLNCCHALKKIIIVIILAEANPNEFWHLKQISGGEKCQERLHREGTWKVSKIWVDSKNQKRGRHSTYNNSSVERFQAWKSMACSENSKMSVMCISWIFCLGLKLGLGLGPNWAGGEEGHFAAPLHANQHLWGEGSDLSHELCE